MQLRPTQQPIETPSYMKFPEWLFKEGTTHKELYPNEETAKNYYTMFFVVMNVTCQIAIAQELKNAINVILEGKTELSTSMEAYEKIRSTVEDVILTTWSDKFSGILEGLETSEPWVKVTYNPGSSPSIIYSELFNKMLKGECEHDFVHQHEVTEVAFTQMSRKTLIITAIKTN